MTRVGHAQGARVNLILETVMLTDEDGFAARLHAAGTAIDYVKAGTGLVGGETTLAGVTRLRQAVGDRLEAKAAGGFRTLANAPAKVAAGARVRGPVLA